MSFNRFALSIGISLLVLGAGLLFYTEKTSPVINKHFYSKPYSVETQDSVGNQGSDRTPAQSGVISGEPNELLIPSLNMDLNVIPGYYNANTKSWNLSLSEVQYAVTTPEPNNIQGATFIYGHYRRAVFAYLHEIPSQAQAIVKTTNNRTFYYQLASIRTTTPADDSVFKYSGPPELVIQTCAGAFFQYRQFYTFNLVRVV